MGNLATKAPNFTSETARAYALKSVESRRLNRERDKALLEQARLNQKPEPDEARKQRVLRQIDEYLDDMNGASLKTRLMIGKAVAELWKLVQPTAGVLRGKTRDRTPPAQPIETPQEPPA